MSQGTCANPVLSSSLSPFSTRGICRDMVHDSAGWVNLCGEDYRCPREKTIELNSPLCDDRNSPPDTCLFSFYQAYLPMAKQVDPLGSIPNSSQHNNSVASTRPPSNHLTAAAVLSPKADWRAGSLAARRRGSLRPRWRLGLPRQLLYRATSTDTDRLTGRGRTRK